MKSDIRRNVDVSFAACMYVCMQYGLCSRDAKLRASAHNTHGDAKEGLAVVSALVSSAYEIVQAQRLRWSGFRMMHQTFKSSNGN